MIHLFCCFFLFLVFGGPPSAFLSASLWLPFCWGDGGLMQGLALFCWIWREKSVPDVWAIILVMPAVDTLPEWPKGVDSSSTSANCVASNPTGVMLWPTRQLLAHRDALLGQGLARTAGEAAQHIFRSNVFCHVLGGNMHRIFITAYRCHSPSSNCSQQNVFSLPAVTKILYIRAGARGARVLNLVLRGEAPYPLGHALLPRGVWLVQRLSWWPWL